MRHRVVVGPVDIRTDLELSVRELRNLAKYATEMALAVIEAGQDETEEKVEPQPMGFTALVERAPDPVQEGFDDDE